MPRNELSDLDKVARHQISQNLKQLTKGMTQRDLSKLTGIPASTLSGYFAERSTPNAGALEKIADALNVQKSDIDPRYKVKKDKDIDADTSASHKPTYNDLGLPYKGNIPDDLNNLYRAMVAEYAKTHKVPKRDVADDL